MDIRGIILAGLFTISIVFMMINFMKSTLKSDAEKAREIRTWLDNLPDNNPNK